MQSYSALGRTEYTLVGWLRRWMLALMGSVGTDFIFTTSNVRFWPSAAAPEPNFCRLRQASVLVKSDANDWSSRMRISDQVHATAH